MTLAMMFVPEIVPTTATLSLICMLEREVVVPSLIILAPAVFTVYVVTATVELAWTVIVRLVEPFVDDIVPTIGRADRVCLPCTENVLLIADVCAYATLTMTRKPTMATLADILFILLFIRIVMDKYR